MSLIPLAAQAYSRGALPHARLVNLYVEATPQGPVADARYGRPGLAPLQTLYVGPIRAVVQTHQGSRYAVSATRVFKDGVQVGIIPGLNLMRWAKSDTQLVMVADGIVYLVGASVTIIPMPDGDLVSDVTFIGGRFVYSILATGKFRWSAVSDATSLDGLDFATAEGAPDAIVSLATLGDELAMFGETTTEWWYPTGDIDAPFQRSQGRRYDKGSAAQASCTAFDNGLVWLGTSQTEAATDLVVFKTGAVPVRISTHAIESMINRCADISTATAFEAYSEGHAFYVLNIPGVASVAYDASTQTWAEWASKERDTFRIQCADGGVYGDADTGALWTLDPERNTDGDDEIQRIVSGYLPTLTRSRLSVLILHCARGVGGPGETPVVEMRYTDGEEGNWSDWRPGLLGGSGERPLARWNQLGAIRAPGRAFQFRCSDDVAFIPYAISVNDAR